MAPRLEFRDVTKTFRTRNRSDTLRDAIPRTVQRLLGRRPEQAPRFTALDGVSFDVGEREVVGIVGANGAGKSTSLRLAARVYRADAGEVIVRGRVSALIELSAGFHPDLSGRENIFLVGALLGLRRREVKERVDRIAAFADIGEFMEAPVRTYSTGMAVRLGFAVAAHVPAELLLVDEVLAVGDIEFRARCLRRMAERRDEGVSVLFVSHNLPTVERFCDRVVFIHNGRVLADGDPRESIAAYRRTVAEGSDPAGGGHHQHHRRGTHELRFDGVRVGGNVDLPPGTARYGEALRISARWTTTRPIREPHFEVEFHTIDRVLCARVVADCVVGGGETWSGAGEIAASIPRVALLPGKYLVGLRALDESGLVVLDHHDKLYEVDVVGEAPSGAEGIVHMPSEWTASGGD